MEFTGRREDGKGRRKGRLATFLSSRLPVIVLSSCATLASAGHGDENLPSSGVGPFRPLTDTELSHANVPPYVFSDTAALYREPSVLPLSSDPGAMAVALYVVAHVGGHDAIVRTHADDARSFYGGSADNQDTSHPRHVPPVVLKADQPWEGTDLSGPSALSVGGQVWLYYAAAGGIGLAQSSDGATFTKLSQPVLAPGSGWESTPPRAPSVAVFPDGSWHMLYAAGDSIGEATSDDGKTWTRVGDPVLAPTPAVDPSTLPPGVQPPFDEGQVGDPLLLPRTTIAGRLQVRVLYTGWNAPPGTASRQSAIGLAGRYGDAGPLSRQSAPVYTVALHEAAPALFEWSGGSLLYVQEDDTSISPTTPFTSIAAAFAPVAGTLPPAAPFPDGP